MSLRLYRSSAVPRRIPGRCVPWREKPLERSLGEGVATCVRSPLRGDIRYGGERLFLRQIAEQLVEPCSQGFGIYVAYDRHMQPVAGESGFVEGA